MPAREQLQVRTRPAEATEGKSGRRSTEKPQQRHSGPTLHVLFNLVSPSLQTRPDEAQFVLGNHARSWTFTHFRWQTRRLERCTRFLLRRGICRKESCIFGPSILPFQYAAKQIQEERTGFLICLLYFSLFGKEREINQTKIAPQPEQDFPSRTVQNVNRTSEMYFYLNGPN